MKNVREWRVGEYEEWIFFFNVLSYLDSIVFILLF